MQTAFPHPLILGHRGSPFDAPENTLRSFALAIKEGADGVELDVRGTRDGVPVVIHDDALDRTTTGSGLVAEHAWPALQRLTAAALPSLEQAVAWAAGARAWLNVEIKADGVEAATLDALRSAGLLDRTILSSFDARVVTEIGRLEPAARRFYLTYEWDEPAQDAVAESGAQGVCLHVDAASALTLEVLRNDDLAVIVWTVDSPERVRELLDHGVAGVITNRPAAAVRARDEWSAHRST